MPKLSEILGAIVKDITHAQITSDMVSLEYAEYYQQDTLLKHMPVPLIKIKDIDVKLKFAISETSISDNLSESAKIAATDIWSNHVKANLVPNAIDGFAKNSTLDREKLNNVVKAAIQITEKPNFDINTIVVGDKRNNRKITENYLVEVVKSLPSAIRKELPSLTEIKKIARENYNTEFLALTSQIKKVAIAKTAESFDLDISVTKDELANASEHDIQELSLKISLEDNPIN